jgi:hypothetical protein
VILRNDVDSDIFLTTTSGVVTPVIGRTFNGQLLARLDLSSVNGSASNLVIGKSARTSGAAPFSVVPCDPPPTATPYPPYQPPVYPPNQPPNNYFLPQPPNGSGSGSGSSNSNVILNQIQSPQQPAPPAAFVSDPIRGYERITPPRTGDADWSAVLGSSPPRDDQANAATSAQVDDAESP